MLKQAIQIFRGMLEDRLQDALDDLGSSVRIAQFVDPFTDNKVEVFDFPGVVVNLAPGASPQAEFKVFEKADVTVPVVVEYHTRDPDTAQARGSTSDVLRAILHVLNDAVVGQASVDNTRLLDVRDLEFDFVVTESGGTGGAAHFHAIMRDFTP